MAVTIREIAKEVGVSTATVSRVLNNVDHPVSEETRREVHEAARRLGYVPNQSARNLRTATSSLIGVLTDAVHSPHTDFIMQGLRDTFRKAGYFCIVINAYWDPDSERREIQELLSHSVAGVVFMDTWAESGNADLQLANTPCVYTHRLFDRPMNYSVVADDFQNAVLATRHLVELGHESIGYISGPPEYYASVERRRGYRSVLADAGLRSSASLEAEGDWTTESGYAACKRLIEAHPEMTGLFAANDRMATGAMHLLADRGLRVPQDVSVIGHDNEEFVQMLRPRLTTVELPLVELGSGAAELLLALIADPDTDGVEIKVPGHLVPGDSTGRREGGT